MDTGVEDATEYFCRAQDEHQPIHPKLVDLHAREYQAFLKNHPSLQFKEGDRVWVQNRTDQHGLHPKLDRIWQGPAEILRKVCTNTYLVNLTGKEVILSSGRLNPYIPRRDGVKAPLHHCSERRDLHVDSYVVEQALDHEYRGKARGKAKKSKQPFEGGKRWWKVEYRGSDRPEWHDVTAFLHDINKDWLDYNQRHYITVSTDSLRKIRLWLDRLICCPDAQPEGVYKLSCLASSLGLNQADPPTPDIRLDVPAAPEPVAGLQWAVSQVASMVFPSLFSSL